MCKFTASPAQVILWNERLKHRMLMMFVLIWATLLFSVRDGSADTGASAWGQQHCVGRYCVTLTTKTQTKKLSLGLKDECHVWSLIVTGVRNGKQDGLTFNQRVTVSVKGLKQKPTVMIPTLTEGQQATLTCTAPGLCSGSVPEITWTWRGAGGTESYITGNRTDFKTENLTTFRQRHSSTLTFNPSAEHHNTNVTCKIHFTGETTTEKTSGLNVNYVKEVKITGVTTVRDSEALNLTCNVHSFPPSLIIWSKLGSNEKLHTDTGSANLVITNVTAGDAGQYVCTAKYMNKTLQDKVNITVIYKRTPQIIGNTTIKEGDDLNLTCSAESVPPSIIMWSKLSSKANLHNDTGSATLVIPNVTAEHSGQYICTAKYMDSVLEKDTNVTVIYTRSLHIIGNTTVKEGDVLNLTCMVESFPPALIVWKKRSSNTDLHRGTYSELHNDTGSATLVVYNVTTEHSGQYICTAKYMNTTLTSYLNVTVSWFSNIQNGSGCVLQSEVLTCVCISEGFPLPTINWPLLKNHTEYSVITTVSNHTVNSTVSLTVKSHGNSTVECVRNNGNGEEREILLIHQSLSEKHEKSSGLRLAYLKVTIAFLTGVLFSAVLCCLAKHCYRNKQKTSRSLEMRTHQDDKLVYDGQALQDNLTLNSNSGPKEVEYADIDFSLLKRNGAREAARRQESTKTIYAEIKKAVEEREDDAEEEGEMLEVKEGEMVVEMEMKYREPEKEIEMGKERVYSTVNDVTDEI
ncbi:sialic acid-binding Ig-like lectin 11 isoform X2 [Oreochromis niloticus]|uniref:sialic acid-binding Ig-like lectin 11 isoform X2 n=1 Tax=Oreochromis niloticus TaxID=8128 RepID=UPI000DF36711|nr:sialic acid-binding Ig-like lectin 11 isoform X2 [Oreochromis niloticus]